MSITHLLHNGTILPITESCADAISVQAHEMVRDYPYTLQCLTAFLKWTFGLVAACQPTRVRDEYNPMVIFAVDIVHFQDHGFQNHQDICSTAA